MLPRERVETTLQFEEPDFVPWGEHSIDYTTYEMVLGRKSFVQGKIHKTKALWEGRRDEVVESYRRDIPDLAEALGFDIITIGTVPIKDYKPKPMEQVDHETYRNERGDLYRVSATTEQLMPYKINTDDWEPPTVEDYQEQIDRIIEEGVPRPDETQWEAARHVIETMQDRYWINTCMGDINYPRIGPTEELRFLNLAAHPELHEKAVEMEARQRIGSLKYYAEVGYDSVMPAGDLGSSTGLLCRPEIIKEHVLPWWKKFTAEAKRLGLHILKHCCGNIWEALDYIVEGGYEGYEGIQASGTMDMKRLKEEYGDRLVLWGGIRNENLIGGTPEDVTEDARYAIKWGAPGGGYIYGASHSLAVGTKPKNLEAMKASRERWGAYPIAVP
ncbi:MAG: uroporphyrinogen decarboxylase family protein [Armatimonadota bacterium]